MTTETVQDPSSEVSVVEKNIPKEISNSISTMKKIESNIDNSVVDSNPTRNTSDNNGKENNQDEETSKNDELKDTNCEKKQEGKEDEWKEPPKKKQKTEVQTRQPRPRAEGEIVEPKQPKRKVAILLGYCGTGYQGMQINPNAKTIEDELHKAFAAAGAVSKDNAMDPNKVQFMRAARTDKGVHALGQCVSLKMIIEDLDIIEKINQNLPEQIRVWDIIRSRNAFHAKNDCDSRIYEYLMPTYVLTNADHQFYPRSKLAQMKGYDVNSFKADFTRMSDAEIIEKFSSKPIPNATAEEMIEKRKFRINQDQLSQVRELLGLYIGTHKFHNFTIGKKFEEMSSNRVIKSFVCSDPFIRQGTEWLSLKVHGQSFMLHQIRKMVGLVILMIRTKTPSVLMKNAFKNVRMNIPKAPSLGLLLDQCVYSNYNKKWGGADSRPNLDFNKHQEKIAQFREKWIYERMINEEFEKNELSPLIFAFEEWMRGVDAHHKEFEWYLTSDGEIDISQKPPHIMNSGEEVKVVREDDEPINEDV